MKLLTSGWLLAALCLTACESHPTRTVYTDQQPVYQDQNPNVVVQPQAVYGGGTTVIHDDNGSDFVTGMALGHMMSNSGGGYNNSGGYGGSSKKSKKTVNITKTYNYTTPAPSPRVVSRPSYQRSTPSVSRPAYQPSRIRSSSSVSSRAVRRR